MPTLPDFSEWLKTFFDGLAKIISEMRKRTTAGIKAIVLVTMSFLYFDYYLFGSTTSSVLGSLCWFISVYRNVIFRDVGVFEVGSKACKEDSKSQVYFAKEANLTLFT